MPDINEIRDSHVSIGDGVSIRDIVSNAHDSVPQLEEELETWEAFYRSNYDVFELIRKWKELNDRYDISCVFNFRK